MKQTYRSFIQFASITILGTLFFTGCGAFDKLVMSKPTPVVQTVPQVQSTTITNQAGVPVTTYQTNFVTATNQVYSPTVNAQVTTGIDTAKQYTGMLPPPYSDAANILLTLFGGAAALYATQRSKALNQSKVMVQSMVAGIEAVPDAASQAVKDSIATHSAAAGVSDHLDAIVQGISNKIN